MTNASNAEAPAATVVGETRLLDGKAVVLTGATGGIGATIARELVSAGAQVALTDLDQSRLDMLASSLARPASDMIAAAVDVADSAAFAGFCNRVTASLGRIDGVINCAGLWRVCPYDEISNDAFNEMIRGNLLTAFVACQVVLPHMVARGSGSIVNFASTAGEYGSISPAAHYAAAKGGVIGLTKSLAREVSPYGVRVNAISPGPTDTPSLGALTQQQKRTVGQRTLFGRLGQPSEIAHGSIFLISDLSTFVTGQVLGVNGGSRL